MTWLLESPWTIGISGIALAILLLAIFLANRERLVLYVLGGVVATTALLLLVERLVVTDREQITHTLYGLARAVERNDVPDVLTGISPSAKELRQEVQSILPRYKIHFVRIGELTVTVDASAKPPTGVTRFLCRVNGKSVRGALPYENLVGRFVVAFQREGEQWRVLSADYHDVR